MSKYTMWRGFHINEAQAKREIRRATARDSRKRVRRGLLWVLCAAVAFGMLLNWAALSMVRMEGDGMNPTLRGGDVVLCIHTLPLPGVEAVTPRRGELALINFNDGRVRYHVVRRVIAVGGDEVFITREGKVTLNGEVLNEPYATYRTLTSEESAGSGLIPNPFALDDEPVIRPRTQSPGEEVIFPVTVPKGQMLVLADDRNTFDDSRSVAFGMVSEDDVLGVPAGVLWPVSRIGKLESFQPQSHTAELNPLPGLAATPVPRAEEGQASGLE